MIICNPLKYLDDGSVMGPSKVEGQSDIYLST